MSVADTTVHARPLETGWRADTPITDTLLRQFLHNQADVNSTLAEARSGRTERRDHVVLADANSPVPYFNQAIVTRPLTEDGRQVLGEIEEFFDGRGRPATLLSIWPTPDLHARGWTLAGHPALVVRAPAPVDKQPRPEVFVRVAEDRDDLRLAERVFVEGYPIDEAVGEPPGSQLPSSLLGSELVVRIGSLRDEAVAVGMGHVGHGVVNLCGGATLPAARRRGVWEAVVWARVSDAPQLPAVAYTSDYSRPGFIRMGFLPITRFTLWVRQF